MRSADYSAARDNAFIARHNGPNGDDVAEMLKTCKTNGLDQLIEQTVPSDIRNPEPLALGAPMSEGALLRHMREIADMNAVFTSHIGQGYYDCITPQVIERNLLQSPAWYTAYTPYQPEISQGRLEALLNFQTMVADLTGLDMANASLLDEATAAAEAMAMAQRQGKSKANAFFVDEACHPQTIAVIQTRAEPLGWDVIIGNPDNVDPSAVFGAIFQYPGTDGRLRDLRAPIAAVQSGGGLAVLACDLLALTLLASPGELGADIAIGSTQRFGVPMGFGGPHAAFMATRDKFKRALPGRIVGVSVDRRGNAAYRLALQTREQHIRREKATSNICTAQALLAITAAMYASYHGPEGLRAIAERVRRLTAVLARGLGIDGPVFDTIRVPVADVDATIAKAEDARINLRRYEGAVGISLDETSFPRSVETLWAVLGVEADFATLDAEVIPDYAAPFVRQTEFLTHPVFHLYRTETEMMRYLRKLSDKDLALDRGMIPLGSCTMKLNAAAEMAAITWPEFAGMHPFCPPEQAKGYIRMIDELNADLCEITGYDAMSMQPNSGAQGEYAGLMAIRGYHRANGDAHRDVCLIPSSAHGTNPASAQMAGMKVVVTGCDAQGNVDIDDLAAKIAQHAENLAAIMITYPSTHGVFETEIRKICTMVHEAGGQVYMDGANLNAQVGLSKPGKFGSDVSHLNLHKTFCIPHGGGGPGMGPIGVGAHLAPYLPEHIEGGNGARQVSAARFGSPMILPIPYAYIKMMGAEGLTQATKLAILNANYIADALAEDYKVLYRGAHGRVAHECILDIRPIKDVCGISNEDIAKRLVDFGFHAPTMSFPVPGTLMIEPTESESKVELDRFIAAMKAIRDEIRAVERGDWPADNNPLINAPHTGRDLTDETWDHPYSRHKAVFPLESLIANKYWPPVNRIDNAYGDRNLICSCPPLESYADAAE
ncbi:MAG: aminomethyl-transferring glycine dehydrogenase [Paracoccaceae bacterium]